MLRLLLPILGLCLSVGALGEDKKSKSLQDQIRLLGASAGGGLPGGGLSQVLGTLGSTAPSRQEMLQSLVDKSKNLSDSSKPPAQPPSSAAPNPAQNPTANKAQSPSTEGDKGPPTKTANTGNKGQGDNTTGENIAKGKNPQDTKVDEEKLTKETAKNLIEAAKTGKGTGLTTNGIGDILKGVDALGEETKSTFNNELGKLNRAVLGQVEENREAFLDGYEGDEDYEEYVSYEDDESEGSTHAPRGSQGFIDRTPDLSQLIQAQANQQEAQQEAFLTRLEGAIERAIARGSLKELEAWQETVRNLEGQNAALASLSQPQSPDVTVNVSVPQSRQPGAPPSSYNDPFKRLTKARSFFGGVGNKNGGSGRGVVSERLPSSYVSKKIIVMKRNLGGGPGKVKKKKKGASVTKLSKLLAKGKKKTTKAATKRKLSKSLMAKLAETIKAQRKLESKRLASLDSNPLHGVDHDKIGRGMRNLASKQSSGKSISALDLARETQRLRRQENRAPKLVKLSQMAPGLGRWGLWIVGLAAFLALAMVLLRSSRRSGPPSTQD